MDILLTKPRVLIVDNNERIRQSYRRLIEYWNFEPVTVEGKGSKLLENAKTLAKEKRCQFAIVDMRLIDDMDDEDNSGIDLIPFLQPAIGILVSAGGTVITAQKGHSAGAVAFLSKEQGPEALKHVLESHAGHRCANFRKLEVGPPDMLSYVSNAFAKYVPEAYHDQIVDVLSELFPKASKLTLEKLSTDSQSPQFSSVPRPKSVVLKVYEDDKEAVIVKMARRHKIEIEQEKYEKYIEDRLVGNYKTTLSNSILLWDIGGAKFTNVGTSAHSFYQLFQMEDVEKLEQCLERFFGTIWSSHYRRATPRQDASLYQLYCDVWGPEWYERAKTLKEFDPSSVMGPSRWQLAQSPHPVAWFLDRIAQNPENDASQVAETYTAVTHGDLHSENLLVDEHLNAWVIDFERSGEGHVLQDFIELESDIINRLNCGEENMEAFYKLCLAVASPTRLEPLPLDYPGLQSSQFQKELRVISFLRELAAKHTPITNTREYLLGLFFNTIFRATLIDENRIPCQHRALMLASIIAHRLDHWDEPWPPQGWLCLHGG